MPYWNMTMDTNTPPTIYISGLPSLSSENIDLYRRLHDERIDLVARLAQHHMRVGDIDGSQPWIKTMLDAAEQADAFLLSSMTALPESHPNYKQEVSQRFFEFFSVVTGIHIGNREKYNKDGLAKPCVIIDSNHQWSKAIDLLRDLQKKGMFTSEIGDIVRIAGDESDTGDYTLSNTHAVIALEETLHSTKRKAKSSVPTRYSAEHVFSSHRKDFPRHPFGFAIFGSATTQELSYKEAVAELGKLAGMRGWRMITGAGTDGCMGAADTGFYAGNVIFNTHYPDAKFKPAHIGVSTQSILRLEGPPPHIDQLIITDNIYDRLEVMIKGQKSSNENLRARDSVKVAFVAPGGTGTLHEFATMMQLATKGDMMKGRTIVLLNFPSHLNAGEGFWDPLIKTAKELGFDDHFVVANSPQEAITIADNSYRELTVEQPELKELPHPVFNA